MRREKKRNGEVRKANETPATNFPARKRKENLGPSINTKVGTCIVVNLVVTPLALLSFPDFFNRASLEIKCCARRRSDGNAYGRLASKLAKVHSD